MTIDERDLVEIKGAPFYNKTWGTTSSCMWTAKCFPDAYLKVVVPIFITEYHVQQFCQNNWLQIVGILVGWNLLQTFGWIATQTKPVEKKVRCKYIATMGNSPSTLILPVKKGKDIAIMDKKE